MKLNGGGGGGVGEQISSDCGGIEIKKGVCTSDKNNV